MARSTPYRHRRYDFVASKRGLAKACHKSLEKAPEQAADATVFLTARPGPGKRADFINDRFVF
jgi:hypothetical protein